jgi:hypothetical protein
MATARYSKGWKNFNVRSSLVPKAAGKHCALTANTSALEPREFRLRLFIQCPFYSRVLIYFRANFNKKNMFELKFWDLYILNDVALDICISVIDFESA